MQTQNKNAPLQVPKEFYETLTGFRKAMIDILAEHGKAVVVDG